MNKAVVGAAALAVVAGGGVGFAAWSGGKVAKELQAQTAAVLAPFPGVKVVENSVSTGLFSSTHTTTLELGCAPATEPGLQPAADGAAPKPVQITWRDHVSHGPLPGGRGVGLAAIDTEIVYSPEVKEKLAKLFGDQAPLTARTVLGFGGGYVSEVTSPAFKYAEAGKGDIDWQGLRATLSGQFTGGTPGAGTFAFEAPGFTMNFSSEDQGAGTVRVGRISMDGSVNPQPGGSFLLAPSQGRGAIASLAVNAKPADGKPVDVLFENLAFVSESRVDGGLWSADSTLSMKGRVDDFPVDQVEMKVSMKRLHAATYEQLIGRMMQSSFSCAKPGDEAAMQEAMALQADLMKGVGTLLAHNPEYAVERLAVVVGGKTAEVAYRFGTRGVTEADAEMPMPVLMASKGYADASFKVDNAWIEQVVKKVVSLKPAPEGTTPEEAVAATMAMIASSVDGLAAQGLMAREGDAIVSKAAFEAGTLKVNGQPMNLPLGQMLGR